MGMTDRIYQIHQLLENRRFVTREELLERLGPSVRTSWALVFSRRNSCPPHDAASTVQSRYRRIVRSSLQPLLSRLSGLLGTAYDSAEEVRKRIRIETVGARECHLDNVHLKLPLVGEK